MNNDIILLSSDSSRPSSPSGPELNTVHLSNLSPISECVAVANSYHTLSDSDDNSNTGTDYFSCEINTETYDLKCSSLEDENASQDDYSSSQSKKRRALPPEERERLKAEKEKAKKERELAKQEKRKAKELKEKVKIERAAAALKRKQMKPVECLKFMTIVFDERLFDMVLCQKALEMFPAADVKITSKMHLVENSIIWNRTQENGIDKEEDFVAVVWVVDKLIEAIKTANLIESFKQISVKLPSKRTTLWIFNLKEYYRLSKNAHYRDLRKDPDDENKNKKKRTDYLTREEIEMALTELQILAGVSSRSFEDYSDFTNLLYQFTKSIAEFPFRKEREKLDNRTSWFCRGESRECIRVDKEMHGLGRLWLQQLCQFNNTSINTARAIVALYPTPKVLRQAYDKCSSQKEKEALLQDIIVKKSNAANAATRKLGPELSRRLCLMFSQSNGDLLLSQES